MRRALIPLFLVAALLAAGAVLVFATGLDQAFARMVLSLQGEFQNALGQSLRALRAGQPGAVLAFLGICFAYGFFHALGPGHGKALIAAWGFGSGAATGPMLGIAALASLGQATVAVLLILAVVRLYDGLREEAEALAARIDPIAMALIACLGLLLLWRGLRHLRHALAARTAPGGAAAEHHTHDAYCGCGHGHAPDPAALAAAQSRREVALLILGIALRPCTGALFLLILTWRLDMQALGIFGVYVMGFGTFMVTGLAALLAVMLRGGLQLSARSSKTAGLVSAGIEILAGGVLLFLGAGAALRMI